MIIRGEQPTHDFYILRNSISNDDRISAEALGVLVYLLSKPPGWEVSKANLRNHFNLGRDKVTRIVKELCNAGYCEKGQTKESDGRFGNNDYTIRDIPLTDKPLTDKPLTDNRVPDNSTNKEQTKEITDSNKEHMLHLFEVAFIDFWTAFPTKVNKEKARVAFRKACEKLGYDCHQRFAGMLVDDIHARISLRQFGFDKLHPTTYLNNARWEDDYPQPDNKTDFSNHSDFVNRHTDTSWAE